MTRPRPTQGHRAAGVALWLACVMGVFVVACGETEDTPAPPAGVPLEILQVRTMDYVLPGTGIRVRARGAAADGESALRLEMADAQGIVLVEMASPVLDGDEHVFYIPPALSSTLPTGSAGFLLRLLEGERSSAAVGVVWHLAQTLEASLYEMPIGNVYRNQALLLGAEGLLAAGEGTSQLEVVGSFETDDGAVISVDTKLFIELVDPLDRGRGQVRLSTAIGGISTGHFTGTARVITSSVTGHVSVSGGYFVDWTFQAPVVFDIGASSASIGQLVSVVGNGFLGGGQGSELTLLRLEGTTTPEGGASSSFGPTSVYVEWVSDEEVKLPIDAAVQSGELVSALFGDKRVTFSGSFTPIVSAGGSDEVVGAPFSVQLQISGGRQVVQVRFLSTFTDSLERFGLRLAEQQVRETTLTRIASIYEGYAVVVGEEVPSDAMPSAVATLEIGGPDPNGIGLFGYDNTPGKDVGNLRLSDSIGGSNAEVQEDGAPGYGGVFIESYLWWSSHPGLSIPRPSGAPAVDPLFDEIFDPVRSTPATLEEASGLGGATRVAIVQRAIRALGSIVGETAAHELGHSFGLAQPHGSKTAYHSETPGPGCLMDSGFDRPLSERAAEPGATETVFCADEPSYLEDVLPLD